MHDMCHHDRPSSRSPVSCRVDNITYEMYTYTYYMYKHVTAVPRSDFSCIIRHGSKHANRESALQSANLLSTVSQPYKVPICCQP